MCQRSQPDGKLFTHSQQRCLSGLRSRLRGACYSVPPSSCPLQHPAGMRLHQSGFLPCTPSQSGWHLPRVPLLPLGLLPYVLHVPVTNRRMLVSPCQGWGLPGDGQTDPEREISRLPATLAMLMQGWDAL